MAAAAEAFGGKLTLGLYEIDLLDKIGQGSFGIVYKGKNTSTNDAVAVKQCDVKDDKVGGDAMVEIKHFQSVQNHPHIVKLHDFHYKNKAIWMVMEYCDAGDLVHYFAERKPEMQDQVNIMYQCASAISYMHCQVNTMIHRDIKPGNILLKTHGGTVIVKITDFGVSKIVEREGADAMKTLMMTSKAGTPGFMAPEFFLSQKYEKSVDVFALGLVFLAMLNFKAGDTTLAPTSGTLLIPIGTQMASISQMNMPMPEFVTLVDTDHHMVKAVKRIIRRMIKFHPKERCSMRQVMITLEDVGATSPGTVPTTLPQTRKYLQPLNKQGTSPLRNKENEQTCGVKGVSTLLHTDLVIQGNKDASAEGQDNNNSHGSKDIGIDNQQNQSENRVNVENNVVEASCQANTNVGLEGPQNHLENLQQNKKTDENKWHFETKQPSVQKQSKNQSTNVRNKAVEKDLANQHPEIKPLVKSLDAHHVSFDENNSVKKKTENKDSNGKANTVLGLKGFEGLKENQKKHQQAGPGKGETEIVVHDDGENAEDSGIVSDLASADEKEPEANLIKDHFSDNLDKKHHKTMKDTLEDAMDETKGDNKVQVNIRAKHLTDKNPIEKTQHAGYKISGAESRLAISKMIASSLESGTSDTDMGTLGDKEQPKEGAKNDIKHENKADLAIELVRGFTVVRPRKEFLSRCDESMFDDDDENVDDKTKPKIPDFVASHSPAGRRANLRPIGSITDNRGDTESPSPNAADVASSASSLASISNLNGSLRNSQSLLTVIEREHGFQVQSSVPIPRDGDDESHEKFIPARQALEQELKKHLGVDDDVIQGMRDLNFRQLLNQWNAKDGPIHEFKIGDQVVVLDDLEKLNQLQRGHGGLGRDDDMVEYLGKYGIVREKIKNKVLRVLHDDGREFAYNPRAVRRTGERPTQNVQLHSFDDFHLMAIKEKFQRCDIVALSTEKEVVKLLQGEFGRWDDEMEDTLGVKGLVNMVNSNGEVCVSFINGKILTVHPEALIPCYIPDGEIEQGDVVVIIPDKSFAKQQMDKIGLWNDGLEDLLGSHGQVFNITKDTVTVYMRGDSITWHRALVKLLAKYEEMKAIVDKHRFSQFEEKNSQGMETQGAKNKTDP